MMNLASSGEAHTVRSTRDDGFTLIEVLIVLVVIGILLLVAIPSYLGFRDRASDATAKANIRAAVPVAEMFAFYNDGTKGDADGKKGTSGYKGMTVDLLRLLDAGISNTLTVVKGKTTQSVYCLRADVNGRTWSARGPGIAGTSFKANKNCK
jgi:type IV pilus assembly protein PilA